MNVAFLLDRFYRLTARSKRQQNGHFYGQFLFLFTTHKILKTEPLNLAKCTFFDFLD